MRVLRRPVALFLVVGVLTVAVIVVGTNLLADHVASDEAVTEARSTTRVLAQSVIQPDLPRGLADVTPQHPATADKMDRAVLARLRDVEAVSRVNLWTAEGRIVYSSRTDLVGHRFALDPDQRRVLAHGGVGSEVADPDRPENRPPPADRRDPAADDAHVVRIYTPVRGPDGERLLFEAYYNLDQIGARRSQIFSSFRWINIGSLLVLIVLATAILVALTRQLRRAARERERLLRSAIDASDAERRRIARDLHDSVVQDLAGTAFSVSAVARSPDLPADSRDTLAGAGTSLRTSLKALRSLLAEIHPPDLQAEGLPAALSDLIAPAGAAGIAASVSVEGAETASDRTAALVWRVAQEAVRNATRHSDASTLAVTVRGDGRRLSLEVVDDGVGFDPDRTDPDSFGLRGLRSLVSDHGGTLEVRSAPGEGTSVRMEVEAQ